MSIPARVTAALTGFALAAGLGVFVFAIVLTGVGFLISAFYVWVEHYRPHAQAAAITGGALLLLAIFIGLAGKAVLKRVKKKQPSLMAEFTGMAGMAGRIAGLLIRRDPRKSIILAVIAGAVAEYVTSDVKKNR